MRLVTLTAIIGCVMTVRIVTQDGPFVLVDTGQPVPSRDVSIPDLREGRVYDTVIEQLLPAGPSLPVGSYVKQGERYAGTLADDHVAAMEARIAVLMDEER